MYAPGGLSGGLGDTDTSMFTAYWQAIKDRIVDLQNLPVWATNHAMKLGIVVTNLRSQGRYDLVDKMQLEIDKVNDDIRRAWKVKGYIDQYLPQWMQAADPNAAPGIRQETEQFGPTQADMPFFGPSREDIPVTTKVSNWFSEAANSISNWWSGTTPDTALTNPQINGLGLLPLVLIGAGAMVGLVYVVTQGMSLYQDYIVKKDLTVAMIEGKLTAGQVAQVITASRPPENDTVIGQIATNVGTNVGTVLAMGVLAYGAFWYLTSRRSS